MDFCRALLGAMIVTLLASCATLPGIAVSPVLDGVWHYAGGEPADDKELHFSTWPESRLQINASQGLWKAYRDPTRRGQDQLFLSARIVAVDGTVLTLKPEDSRRAFQVYWRIVEGRLEFWWGNHPDWLKPHVIYVRLPSP